ncbi:MAG: hypothetical protein HC769_19355 [Cyanobacteria bacterium CRU_2_1]|nr:hypothetical protein [Cyanobacteria bacterium RU_5_0]NJR60785.1 hypothetical protein [Cyanobacteria bacterium CRU_2_1]
MSNSLEKYYEQACEITIPIKLNVPIYLEPRVLLKAIPGTTQKLPVHLEPEIYVGPEVKSAPTVCVPQNGYKRELPAQAVSEQA